MRDNHPYQCTFFLMLVLGLAMQFGLLDPCQATENKQKNSQAGNLPTSESEAHEQQADLHDQEQEVDLDEEESLMQDQPGAPASAHTPHPGGHFSQKGLKLFVDLLMEVPLGEDRFEFSPHHTYVILQSQVTDNVAFSMHLSDAPLFYELHWFLTPSLRLKAGKVLIPFGTNEFHHLIGGRVDELLHFLPDMWADFGVGLSHLAYDGDLFSIEYDLCVVNGFNGLQRPIIASGTVTDNNLSKGLGARVTLSVLGKFHFIGSLYFDIWDEDDKHSLIYYSAGFEMTQGSIDLPILDRVGFRGEWSRGEFQLEQENNQSGLFDYAYARGGFYAEILGRVWEDWHIRFRTGLINPDNTIKDEGDLWVFEPAMVFGRGKLTYIVAYQMTKQVGLAYSPTEPADMLYGKFFLQF